MTCSIIHSGAVILKFSLYLRKAIFITTPTKMFRRKIEIPLEIEVHILIAFQLKKRQILLKGNLWETLNMKSANFFYLKIIHVFSTPIILCNCGDIHHTFTDLNLLLDKTPNFEKHFRTSNLLSH